MLSTDSFLVPFCQNSNNDNQKSSKLMIKLKKKLKPCHRFISFSLNILFRKRFLYVKYASYKLLH